MKRLILVLYSFTLVAACTVGPDYHQPTATVPEQWSAPLTSAKQENPDWWQTFNDAILNQLIKQAVAANLDLAQATTRIRQARAQQTIAVAAGLPIISGKSSVSRRSNNISTGGTGSASTTGGGFGIGNQIINIFQAGFDAQWELDIFGGIRRGVEAAEANVAAEQENRRDVLVTLLAEVARNYTILRGNQQKLQLATANLKAQQDTLELTKVRQRAGLASSLEASQQQALLLTTAADLPNYQQAIELAIHSLSTLLALPPTALTARLQTPAAIPVASPVLSNLPSELLQRRPDIRRTERQVAAANAQIGVAKAELYPKFNLAAFLGLQNTRITDLTALSKSWSTAASISVPIFNWGKLQANIKSKQAEHEQILLSYQSTVLTALKEVEDALTSYKQEQQRLKTLTDTVTAQQLVLHLVNQRYEKGLTSFLDVLDSQRSVYQSQNSLIDSQAQSAEQLIALYKALGGGWQHTAEPTVSK